MADVTIPNLANLTDELKGAGLGGTTNYFVAAHYQDWEITLNFHTIVPEGLNLMRQDGFMIEAMAGMQYKDPALNRYYIGGWRFTMACFPKGFDLGKLEVGTKENNAVLLGCDYIKATLDGKVMFEKDKVNLKDFVLDTDYAAPIRKAIGIGS